MSIWYQCVLCMHYSSIFFLAMQPQTNSYSNNINYNDNNNNNAYERKCKIIVGSDWNYFIFQNINANILFFNIYAFDPSVEPWGLGLCLGISFNWMFYIVLSLCK